MTGEHKRFGAGSPSGMDVGLILPFPDVESCIAAVPGIKLANLDPQSIEFMDVDIIKSSAAFTGNPVFPTELCGEHAIGYAKKEYLRESVGDTAYGLMAAIKRVFDPDMILNPGKVCSNVCQEGE